MTEKELVNKIKGLKQVKPQKDWVVLAKSRILEEEVAEKQVFANPFGFLKPALATLSVFAVLFGIFTFAQNSVPGDLLYSIKRLTEKSQAVFVSEENKPQASLETAKKRLEELTKIVEANQTRSLAPAINEFQASISEATKNLSKMGTTASDPVAVKEMVDKTKEIEGKIEEFRSLGIYFEGEEFDQFQEVSNKLKVESLISDLEEMALAEEQEQILSRMKDLAEEEKYSESLELFLTEFNQAAEKEEVEEEEKEKEEVEEEVEEEVGEEVGEEVEEEELGQ